LILKCSHFQCIKDKKTPCIIYCHGNSGSRLDCLDIIEHLLPINVSVVAFDFSGSGQSEGEWVSMGYYEKDDIKSVVEYLEHSGITQIGLWGRSMGAVSALLYASYHRNIDFVIAESPFASLRSLCVDLVNIHTVNFI
jgi:pimeloyl-ACP methyl ester carboxylesterase